MAVPTGTAGPPGTAAPPGTAGPPVAALDIGGTKLEAGVVDRGGRILSRVRVDTPRWSGPTGDEEAAEELLELCVGAVRSALSDSGAAEAVGVLGVGCGGPMQDAHPGSSTGRSPAVSPLNIAQWRDFPLRDRLAGALGIGVLVDNDAKALALAEGAHGAAAGVSDYLAMVVSTGVGGGIVLDGRLLHGRRGNAGHVGHVIVDPLGRVCGCGARGCLEAEASGRAIEAITGVPASEAGPATRRRTGRLVGRAVASVCNLLDLDLVVVAGSVALGFGEPFLIEAQAELDRLARLEHSRGARIRFAELGSDGPLIGAACVATEVSAPSGAP